jgi:hypothetical protein
MMKVITFLACIYFTSNQANLQYTNVNAEVISELNSLAKSVGYEYVDGDRYPIINPYGSYGASCVFDILMSSESRSVLFLCRKPNKFYQKKDQENVNDLVNFYDYALIFAIRNDRESNYKIQNVIENEVGLMGLYLHYGILEKELSEFVNVKNKVQYGPKGKFADYRSGSLPVFISSQSAFVILYYYEGEWFEYKEIED